MSASLAFKIGIVAFCALSALALWISYRMGISRLSDVFVLYIGLWAMGSLALMVEVHHSS